MAVVCPHCGFSIVADEPVSSGGWLVEPTRLFKNAELLNVTQQEAGFAYAIARSGGKLVSRNAVLSRISDSDDAALLNVVICRLRRKAPGLPIELVRGKGYRWTGD